MFFFEKKNQKTFICFGQHLSFPGKHPRVINWQKFFGSFFQKRTSSFLFLPRALWLVVIGAVTGHAASAQTIPVLVYHRFDPSRAAPMTVTLPAFEQQLDWLAVHHYQVVKLSAVVGVVRGTEPAMPGRAVAITVDDGHESVYQYLYPIVLRRHLNVTLFIYPSAISNASYALTWPQLADMVKSGLVDVQSHTYWHPNFNHERAHRTADDYSRFVDFQLQRSKDVLQSRLGVHVTMLAWPYGIFDTVLEAAATRAGYEDGFAFAGGWAHPGGDMLAIPRIPVAGSYGLPAFAALFPPATP